MCCLVEVLLVVAVVVVNVLLLLLFTAGWQRLLEFDRGDCCSIEREVE